MEFADVVRTTPTCRYYRPDPVPSTVIGKVLDAARWAPSGGNRQPLRFIVVRDRALKQKLQDLYLPIWDRYVAGIRQGSVRVGAKPGLVDHADEDGKRSHRAERERGGLGKLRFHRSTFPVGFRCTGTICAGSSETMQKPCQLRERLENHRNSHRNRTSD